MAIARQVNKELIISTVGLYLVVDRVKRQHTCVSVFLWLLLSASLSIDLAHAARYTLFLWYHALLELVQDWEKLAGRLFDVGHRRF